MYLLEEFLYKKGAYIEMWPILHISAWFPILDKNVLEVCLSHSSKSLVALARFRWAVHHIQCSLSLQVRYEKILTSKIKDYMQMWGLNAAQEYFCICDFCIKILLFNIKPSDSPYRARSWMINRVKAESFCRKAKRNVVQQKAAHDLWRPIQFVRP